MNNTRTTDPDPRRVLRTALDETLAENVELLIDAIRKEAQDTNFELQWFATQLEFGKSSPDLLREVFLVWVMRPNDKNDPRVIAARKFLRWSTSARDFDKLRPQFLDVIYLLPPRDFAVIETLVPLLEHRPSELPQQPQGPEMKTLFDIGTGTGLLIQILRKAGLSGKMVGIDPASNLTNYAFEKFKDLCPDVDITIHTIQDYKNYNQQFQTALCYMVLHHVPTDMEDGQYKGALSKIFDVLAEGGTFVYTDKLSAELIEGQEPKAFDFKTAPDLLMLKSGQELIVEQAELTSVRPFQPHPQSLQEYPRDWKKAAEILSKTGFLIQSAKPLNERVVLFVCRKPHTSNWVRFAENPAPEFRLAWTENNLPRLEEHAPYQWTIKLLEALYRDVTGEKECPKTFEKIATGFLRGIAYFSWEKASRLFLVRRAVPFDFHILSYSHVHEGWGSLGRMVEEFEKDPKDYVENIGYSCLTRDAVQRTLPFQGDIEHLKYEAAMAIPIYNGNSDKGYQLRGAFLFYLAKPEFVPLHTGSDWQKLLIGKFKKLNEVMNYALDWQEEQLKVTDSARVIFEKWETLAREKRDVVIGRLEIKIDLKEHPQKPAGGLPDLCSKIQALLSGSEFFSVLNESNIQNGQAIILVAARYGISYEEIRENILMAIGTAAESYGSFSYSCKRLGHE